jgi:hypothetical protein
MLVVIGYGLGFILINGHVEEIAAAIRATARFLHSTRGIHPAGAGYLAFSLLSAHAIWRERKQTPVLASKHVPHCLHDGILALLYFLAG